MESITTSISKLAVEFAATTNQVYAKIEKHNYEPLDGDRTENIGKLFLLELDLLNGNITNKEYEHCKNTIMKNFVT